jgi:hypothetical protein
MVAQHSTGDWMAWLESMPVFVVLGSTETEAIERLTAVSCATIDTLATQTTRVEPLPVIDVTAD